MSFLDTLNQFTHSSATDYHILLLEYPSAQTVIYHFFNQPDVVTLQKDIQNLENELLSFMSYSTSSEINQPKYSQDAIQSAKLSEQLLHLKQQYYNELKELHSKLPTPKKPIRRPTFGSAKGLITIADNFDEPLDDFAEYM